MQVQDYLPFFQALWEQYYQLTLENPAYAACLAVAVWLLTSIFYSVRILFLNKRNRATLKTSFEAQDNLANAQQQIQGLQDEISAGKALIEQEAQRGAALQERIEAFAALLRDSILALAAAPELGQQGLSVSNDLAAEHLWQRYSAAVKDLGERLIAAKQSAAEWQQAVTIETSKVAEKDRQLQAVQEQLDKQTQQLAGLELAIAEHKNQLALQEQQARQQLEAIEAKQQADAARLAELDRLSRTQTTVMPEVAVASPEPVKAVEPKMQEPVAAAAVSVPELKVLAVEPAPQPVQPESKPQVPERAIENKIVEPKVEAGKKTEKASGLGKFKSLFSGAKQQIEKIDDMFGLSTPMLEPEEPIQRRRPAERIEPTFEVAPPPAEPEIVTPPVSPEPVKVAVGGLGGKFKTLFAKAPSASETVVEASSETFVEPPEPVIEVADTVSEEAVKTTGKFKNLFGKLKKS